MEKDKPTANDRQICRALITVTESDEYDFECVAVPADNGQMRYSYENSEYFLQVLRTGKDNIDTSRLDSGIPLFDNHPWDNSAENTLGITVAYDFTDKGLVVRCKFGARADEALRSDVKNGIVKTVSIEGTISNYSVERKPGMVPMYMADLWTPESLSFAPVPNDIAAQIEVKRAIQKQIETPKADISIIKSLITKF
jgi:hypothetical protein